VSPAVAAEPSPGLLGLAPKADAQAGKETQTQPAKEGEAPPTQDLQVKLPEGWALDRGVMDNFTALAKDLKLDSQNAQRLVDQFVQVQQSFAQQQQQAQVQRVEEWGQQVRQSYGTNFDSNINSAQRGVEFAGGEALRTVLNQTGLGNHPVLVEAFRKIGAALADDKIAGTAAPGPRELTEDEKYARMYPNTKFPETR
jgi:hypothetical protein